MIDAKSPYTYRHSEGVAAYADAVGRVPGFDADALRDLRRAALLHRRGKAGRQQPDPGQIGKDG